MAAGTKALAFFFFAGMKKERGNMHLTRAEHKAGAQAYKQAINPGLILLSTEPASHSSVCPVLPRPRSTEALLKFSDFFSFIQKKKKK